MVTVQSGAESPVPVPDLSGCLATAVASVLRVRISNGDKPNPLLATLKEKVLQEKEITQPESGLLYFQIVGGKLKPKDLELHYKGPAGRLSLRFRS